MRTPVAAMPIAVLRVAAAAVAGRPRFITLPLTAPCSIALDVTALDVTALDLGTVSPR